MACRASVSTSAVGGDWERGCAGCARERLRLQVRRGQGKHEGVTAMFVGVRAGSKTPWEQATGRRERRAGRYNPFVLLRVCQE